MRLYAQTRARRTRQVLADLLAVALLIAVVAFALTVRDALLSLAEPGRRAQSAGDDLVGGLDAAADTASGVPLIGGALKKPLQAAAAAGDDLSDAGQSLQHFVGQVADLTALALVVFPVVLVLALWLPPRLYWIRHSAATRRLRDAPGGADLLALRALSGSPRALAAVPAPPGGLADAWRRRDRRVIAELAEVALGRAGLRP
ncbi:hypothetical protein NX794_24695 [Streptomyces sp. LP11]|uniref:Transmembrane protein n=1 Tax=Streptomyces pyxinicus TaxID=2970331 RepID=A0ABT2B7A3_9ACTN|nr:hypothetical protein [Streptomyces sp. LP11]MCS0604386.1 hypothetical protein [Streptomyces sp. LP11]